MTQEAALQEARRRWGPDAVAKLYPAVSEGDGGVQSSDDAYFVGDRLDYPTHFGMDESWEAAFSDADRRDLQSAPPPEKL